MWFFLTTLSTIEIKAPDITPFKITNTSVGQNNTLKGQFHSFANVQALALAVVNFTVSY